MTNNNYRCVSLVLVNIFKKNRIKSHNITYKLTIHISDYNLAPF